MIKRALRQIAQTAGFEVYRTTEPRRWSHTVDDYYHFHPRPRWGHGSPSHLHLVKVLEKGRRTYEEVLLELWAHRDVLQGIEAISSEPNSVAPVWDNGWLPPLDSASLVAMILSRKPKRYIEIGSGNSTLFARYAVNASDLDTKIMSIDPTPRREIDAICDRVVRRPLEDCDLAIFEEMGADDVLYFDGSHRTFTNSDVTTFFLDVMPKLKPGVVVHLHDIFLPDDYPPEWNQRLYSEQYMLAAMLLCGLPPFRVILPNYFVSHDSALAPQVRRIFKDIKSFSNRLDNLYGGSFWFEMSSKRIPDGAAA